MTILSEIHTALGDSVEIVTAAGTLGGMLIGNWLSLGRDKRREFNEIVSPIYFRMKKYIDARCAPVEDIAPDVFDPYIVWFQKADFRKCVERYQNAKRAGKHNPETQVFEVSEAEKAETLRCADNVLHYIKPR